MAAKRKAARALASADPPRGGAPATSIPPRPSVPAPVAAATGAAFAALSRLRGARIFHPRGVGFEATVTVERPVLGYPGVPLLKRPGSHPAVVRLSRAAGLPAPLPDALGLTVRLIDLHGPGRHQDFLLVTSVDAPLLHHVLLPAPGGFLAQSYSSLLPYRIGGHTQLVGAEPIDGAERDDGGRPERLVAKATARTLRFSLGLAPLGGKLHHVATLEVGDRLDADVTERLAFTPWNSGGGIEPVGPLQGLRRAAYAGSQRGRGLPPTAVP